MASGLGGRALVGVPAGFDDAGGHVEVVFAGADYLLGATCLFS